jgi:hypothetical protein
MVKPRIESAIKLRVATPASRNLQKVTRVGNAMRIVEMSETTLAPGIPGKRTAKNPMPKKTRLRNSR